MILSASRRTDIPAFYSDWFINRLKSGYLLVRNPMNHAQVSKIILSPEAIDCIVFWTKNPANLLPKLDLISELGYRFYFQFTLTPYDKTVEKNLPDKGDIIDTFMELSQKIGRDKVLWRYDPIILNKHLTAEYHLTQFEKLCEKLHQYTSSVTISFVDRYAKLKTNLIREITEEEMIFLSQGLSKIAKTYGLSIKSCCEKLSLSQYGVEKASCIDKTLVEKLCGYALSVKNDRNQRLGCGCVQSVDVGAYNTCQNGCIYCYANYSASSVSANIQKHDRNGEFLLGQRLKTDKIKERKI